MSSPTKALNPLSPERMNQQMMPGSPSLPSEIRGFQNKSSRGNSDVQGKIAFLNNLSRGNSPAAGAGSGGTTAALQRALLGREEAESALASASSQLSDAQSRERRLTERLDSLMEEFHNTKERQAHERSVFEKEIRKARKEAFRAGSTVVKMQEELKHARAEAKMLKEEIQVERESKDKARQEAFERAYALAGLTEELEVLKGRLRSVEANSHSDNLEAQAKKMNREDIGRMSLAEGDLAMFLTPTPRRPKRYAEDSVNSPLSRSADQTPVQQTPPKRQRLSDVTVHPEEDTAELDAQQDIIGELKDVLKHEKRLRIYAEDMVHFLQMECEFKRCACRLMEGGEADHTHEIEATNVHENEVTENPESDGNHATLESNQAQHLDPAGSTPVPTSPAVDAEPAVKKEKDEQNQEPVITFSPVTGTFRAFPSPIRDNNKRRQDSEAFQALGPQFHVHDELQRPPVRFSTEGSENAIETDSPIRTVSPTPTPMRAIRKSRATPQVILEHGAEDEFDQENIATTNVPLNTEPRSSNQFDKIEGTSVSREEALAQIRARRGRANSMKRSISLSESQLRSGGMGVTPVRTAKRTPGIENSNAKSQRDSVRSRRDLSAPVRMLR
ncbi:hypothetical protein ASPWEDRAFT_40020 [Aspergillus wentii DTO 134E9]|uniref:Uncharacterized protein n=1 Tax=Aspergillus wentii DTO 134E9 TaxID=1073089 RepID=A0A1L9RIZ8_ASPWE|nr:uncharacterized protein ASPWEDRAFT_40020 [Aspergillus wentii DTO 134E9]OJJ34902.1 hypothetical protein ASPWEDRAFT_40020 [Aspergillus wentii DTO 134E9]